MAPAVAELETKYESDVRFIGISGQDNTSEMQVFVEDFNMGGFEHVADINGQIWTTFGVNAQPSYVFINSGDGAISRHVGGMRADDLEAAIEQLIKD